jgi:uncharacterized alkaline shock family protein YloU
VTSARWEALPCGAHPELLVEHATQRAEALAGSHEMGCAYCQAALREFAELWLPVRQWAEREISVPRRFIVTVISRVRRIVESSRHTVSTSGRGVTTVTSWALALVTAAAAEDTPGVTVIAARSAGPGGQAVVRRGADSVRIDEADEGALSVALAVTAGPVNAWAGESLADLADTVRHNVIAAITDHTQLSVAAVDVDIDDLDLPLR